MWTVVSPAPADAYILNVDGCKFPGTNPTIRYKFISVTGTYKTATRGTRDWWNNSSVPGLFSESTTSSPEINVYDGAYGGSYLAKITGGLRIGRPMERALTFYWKMSNLDGTTSTRKKITGTHELGHTYGLRHAGGNSCNTSPVPCPYSAARAVMNQPSDLA
jgi:hypothetical protein